MKPLAIHHEILTVRTRRPFAIARGTTTEFKLLRIRVRDADGMEGWGEAAPNRFYGETIDTAVAALDRLTPVIAETDPWHLEALEARMNAALRFNGSVKSAVSAAFHDLAGKRLGVPLYRMWGLDPAAAPKTTFTVPLAPDDTALANALADARNFPILKVKLGGPRDAETITAIRTAEPDKVLRVDANAAWSPKQALTMIEMLLDYEVELVEQPVAAPDLEGLRFVRERSPLPIIADESCVTLPDVAKLAGVADGINIKLSKCGGLREALKMIATARAHGMLVMCGCMVESSLGITAAAHLAPLLDYADLDGAALLSDDPHVGATVDGGVIRLPDAPGLGVAQRATA